MVCWYRQRVAVNEDTGQRINVYTSISDWDIDIHPTMFFEYFNNLPIFNTFQLLFTTKLTPEGQAKGEIS